jgi:hypothetical protein
MGVAEYVVRDLAQRVDLALRADRDGDAGDDPRFRAPGFARGLPDAWDDVLRDGALVGHPEDRSRRVATRDTEHHGRQRSDQDRRRSEIGHVDRAVHPEYVILDVDLPRTGERRVQHLEGAAHRLRRTLVR